MQSDNYVLLLQSDRASKEYLHFNTYKSDTGGQTATRLHR